MSNESNKVKKRNFDSIVGAKNIADNMDKAKIGIHEKTMERVKLSSVKMNFKNKRVATQLLRFIPDKICAEAMLTDDPVEYVKSKISLIPINNIILEFRTADSEGDADAEIFQYERHEDIYNPEEEGIFIGKGICFHNIQSDFNGVSSLADEFVENVIINGKSLSENEDLVENPRIMKIGGQRYKLAFGHNRYCYLTYHHGQDYVYKFDMSLSGDKEDLKIYIENNTKKKEKGYEQIQSYCHVMKDYKWPADIGLLCTILGTSKSNLYEIRPFSEDNHLLKIVKRHGFLLSKKKIIAAISEAKKDLSQIGRAKDKALVYEVFTEKLEAMSRESDLPATGDKKKDVAKPEIKKEKRVTYIKTKIPNNHEVLKKLLFEDVRSWSKLITEDYDLSDKKDLNRYLMDLVDEALNENNEQSEPDFSGGE